MKTEQQLIEQRTEIDSQLHAIREKRELAENKAKVGKCFVYRGNCYSGIGAEKWDVFYRVESIDDDGDLTVYRVEIDCDGKVEFETKAYLGVTTDECDESEYYETLQRAIQILTDATPKQ